MTKKTPEEMIKELHQEARYRIESQQEKLNSSYEQLPYRVKVLSEMTGMDEATLITAAVRVTHSHANLTWDQVLSVVHTFYLHKRNLEREQEGQED
jgi:hypothetical protein